MLRQDFDRRVGEIGVTRSQWMMIAAASRKAGATQREIAELLEMTEASAGRLIDRLCAEGLLERQSHAGDRRARCIHVTEKAAPLMERLSSVAEEARRRTYRNFSEEELEELIRLLDKIYSNLGGQPLSD